MKEGDKRNKHKGEKETKRECRKRKGREREWEKERKQKINFLGSWKVLSNLFGRV